MQNRNDGSLWYAVQNDSTDAWDSGSYDFSEAMQMALERNAKLIAVIDESGGESFCIDEINIDSYREFWEVEPSYEADYSQNMPCDNYGEDKE